MPKSLTGEHRLLYVMHGNEKVKVISRRVSCNNVVSSLDVFMLEAMRALSRSPFQSDFCSHDSPQRIPLQSVRSRSISNAFPIIEKAQR